MVPDALDKKKCTVCKRNKCLSEYHNSSVSRDGKGYRCQECDKSARAGYRKRNLERFREVARKKQLKHAYGITPDDFDRMLLSQEGKCAICRTCNPNGPRSESTFLKNFAVDHCHDSGKVRGLLCNNCNRSLGLLGDSVDVLRSCLDYLIKHETH